MPLQLRVRRSMSASSQKSMWWQAGPFEQWVQEVLISVLVPDGASVCELMCGSGKALGKWQRAKLGQYVGVGALTAHQLQHRPLTRHNLLCSLTSARPLHRSSGARDQRS